MRQNDNIFDFSEFSDLALSYGQMAVEKFKRKNYAEPVLLKIDEAPCGDTNEYEIELFQLDNSYNAVVYAINPEPNTDKEMLFSPYFQKDEMDMRVSITKYLDNLIKYAVCLILDDDNDY